MRVLTALLTALCLAFASAAPAAAETGFAPNVTLTDMTATVPLDPIRYADGREGTLADYEGEVLVVTLWQKNCPFCHKEMPGLNRLSSEMDGTGVRVLALGLDQDMGLIQGYLSNAGMDAIEPIMDVEKINGSIFSIEHFGRFTIATPTSFIVDKSGKVTARIWGLIDWDGDAARDYLRGLAAS